MNARQVLLALGLAAALGGLAMAFVPSLSGVVDSPSEVPLVLGVAAIGGGLLRLRTWIGHDDEDFRPIERERPIGIGAPGRDFDRLLRRAPEQPSRGGNTRRIMIRQSLREAAITTLTTYHGHTESSARKALNRGTWTDDDYAIEFFNSTHGTGGSLSESVTSRFSGNSPFHRRADRAAREIERLAGRDR